MLAGIFLSPPFADKGTIVQEFAPSVSALQLACVPVSQIDGKRTRQKPKPRPHTEGSQHEDTKKAAKTQESSQ